jgi:hypothetical protein
MLRIDFSPIALGSLLALLALCGLLLLLIYAPPAVAAPTNVLSIEEPTCVFKVAEFGTDSSPTGRTPTYPKT